MGCLLAASSTAWKVSVECVGGNGMALCSTVYCELTRCRLFIIEGLGTVVVGAAAYLLLPGMPLLDRLDGELTTKTILPIPSGSPKRRGC